MVKDTSIGHKGHNRVSKVKRRCFHRMITGLDCRMTSPFLDHTSRRGEQSNPQSTEANMLQSLGGAERHNNLCTPLHCVAVRAGRAKVTASLNGPGCTPSHIIQHASSKDTRPMHFIYFTLVRLHCWIEAHQKSKCQMLRA